ncbi:MAG TPA: carboxypeptidase-like regulatory domain-containing protein [Chitinophagaceae bacterium]|nr:carboxypeptidase-like regulatory domain-containing protein [Chitinophagaceae bacterium]
MKFQKCYILCFTLLFPLAVNAQFGVLRDTIVQFSGVTMTADSLRAIPGVDIQVLGTDRGTISNEKGVFAIVAFKGDVIHFSAVGFRPKDVKIPVNLKGSHFSMIQLMVQDTFYLPVTIIRPYPSRSEFEYAFVNWKLPDDQFEIARKNVESEKLRALRLTVPTSAQESVNNYFNNRAQAYYYNGQVPPENIFNPLAWAQFIQAWKRGDFKNQN